MRGSALLALAAVAALDVLLIALAVKHSHGHPRASVITIGNQIPDLSPSVTATPSPSGVTLAAVDWTPGADPVALSSYGSCHDGYATVDGNRISGVQTVLAATKKTGVLVGLDMHCKPQLYAFHGHAWTHVTSVTVPTGIATASAGAIWVVGPTGGVVINAKGTVVKHPTSPCTDKTLSLTPSYATAISTATAVVFCTAKPTSVGQIRLIYATTDGGKTWAEYAGARTIGKGATGRKDGLDGDGRLVGAAALGGDNLGVLLAGSGCTGLQLRTSKDRGRNWVAAGCLPKSVPTDHAVLGGNAKSLVIGDVVDGTLTTYASTDNGKTWAPK